MKRTRMFKGYYKFMKEYDKYYRNEYKTEILKKHKTEIGNSKKLRIRQLNEWA